MNRYPQTDYSTDAGEWLMGAIRRNPEGLLLLAAGCALLMRSGSSGSARRASESRSFELESPRRSESSNFADGISRAAESASDYASGIKNSVTDAASSYASTVSNYANEARSTIADQSERISRQAQSTFQGGMDRMLREQPLAVAVLGVAAGAAVAAAFPSTDVENRALGAPREALSETAGKAGENLMKAAGAAGERLKAVAEEKGLNPEGLKDMAREVAGTFAGSVTGKTDEPPTLVPAAPADRLGVGAAPRASGLTSTTGRDGR
jgi:gas vesicle protein